MAFDKESSRNICDWCWPKLVTGIYKFGVRAACSRHLPELQKLMIPRQQYMNAHQEYLMGKFHEIDQRVKNEAKLRGLKQHRPKK